MLTDGIRWKTRSKLAPLAGSSRQESALPIKRLSRFIRSERNDATLPESPRSDPQHSGEP